MITRDALGPRSSHADSDHIRREMKARQIVDILSEHLGDLSNCDVLDIGTGSGIAASLLDKHAKSVRSVDVVDERVVRDVPFQQITSEILPIPAKSFDIVVSNHVVEHVRDKLTHLKEVRRVLRPGAIAYLAMPNKWSLIEPHFQLPFLSWLPKDVQDRYVRWTRKGAHYDVDPLTYADLVRLSQRAGLSITNVSTVLASRRIARITGVTQCVSDRLHLLFPSYVVLLTRTRDMEKQRTREHRAEEVA